MNTPIPVAVIGLNFGNMIAKELARGVTLPHARLAAVCDQRAPIAERWAKELGVPGCTDIDQILKDPAIPAVALITRPAGRAGLLKRCLDAGKHVMTTKPFERDARAAADILAYARTRKLALHLNSPAPEPSEDIAHILQWRDANDLGRAVHASFTVHANYQETASDDPATAWYDDPTQCPIAPLYRLGIYGINDMISILGCPESVQATSLRFRTGRPTADNALALLRFPGGALATLAASFCVGDGAPYGNRLEISWERGSAWRDPGPLALGDPPTRTLHFQRPDGSVSRVETRFARAVSGHYNWELFAKAIRGQHAASDYDARIVAGVATIEALARAELSGAMEKVGT